MYEKNVPIELKNAQTNKQRSKSLGHKLKDPEPVKLKILEQPKTEELDQGLLTEPAQSIWSVVWSYQFVLIYLVTLIKTSSNFYYSCEMKGIGLVLIGDDKFVTNTISFGILMSFFMRLSMGFIFQLFGLKMTYLTNVLLEIIDMVLLFFGGRSKSFYFMFIMCNRLSSGK